MITVYTYQKCTACRAALRWLDANHIDYTVKAIRETPPSKEELRAALTIMQGKLRPLFNTSGNDYRQQGLADRLPQMDAEEAINRLHANGNLVKRPFLIGDDVALTGFNPEVWRRSLLG